MERGGMEFLTSAQCVGVSLMYHKLEVFSEDVPHAVLWYICGTKWPWGWFHMSCLVHDVWCLFHEWATVVQTLDNTQWVSLRTPGSVPQRLVASLKNRVWTRSLGNRALIVKCINMSLHQWNCSCKVNYAYRCHCLQTSWQAYGTVSW